MFVKRINVAKTYHIFVITTNGKPLIFDGNIIPLLYNNCMGVYRVLFFSMQLGEYFSNDDRVHFLHELWYRKSVHLQKKTTIVGI